MAGVIRLQERIATMMHGGISLERVEEEVIEPSGLTEDRKAALWLYAWSFKEGREQRDEATRHLLSAR